MIGQLVVIAGPDQGRTFPLAEGQSLTIGRGQATDTKLKDPQASRNHGKVSVDGRKVILEDAGSTGGTHVNGRKVPRADLKHGDVVQMGNTQFRFEMEGHAEASTVMVGAQKATGGAEALTELVGTTLGHFKIEEIIAKGLSSVIFKATDKDDGSTVALKVLQPQFSQNDEDMQRFVRAMKTMMPVKHPNLVMIHGAGRTGQYCWVAMEYVPGDSVTEVIRSSGVAGMLDWRHTLKIAVQIARALAHAHEHNVIHRNVTPANIIIREGDKSAKLGDLMLAKALEGTLAQQVTRPGELIGDVEYMSPERTRGGTVEIDERSDIYGLGATVYALLAGRPPFEGESLVETITKIRNAEPIKPKKYQMAIPDQFEGVVMHMLAKRPEDRFQTAAEMVEELERVAKFQNVTV